MTLNTFSAFPNFLTKNFCILVLLPPTVALSPSASTSAKSDENGDCAAGSAWDGSAAVRKAGPLGRGGWCLQLLALRASCFGGSRDSLQVADSYRMDTEH